MVSDQMMGKKVVPVDEKQDISQHVSDGDYEKVHREGTYAVGADLI